MTDKDRDPLGKAIYDYHKTGVERPVRVDTTYTEDETIDAHYFFRKYPQMPVQEQKALELCRGKVLDAGAGAGCHSLELTKRGIEVVSVEISSWCVDVMKERGVEDARLMRFEDLYGKEKFDTLLMLMNGIGMTRTLEGLRDFLSNLGQILNEGGQFIMDSSDLIYLFMNDDGSVDIDLNAEYHGEVVYDICYDGMVADPFGWLYVGYPVLEAMCEELNLNCEHTISGEHFDFLARITLK